MPEKRFPNAWPMHSAAVLAVTLTLLIVFSNTAAFTGGVTRSAGQAPESAATVAGADQPADAAAAAGADADAFSADLLELGVLNRSLDEDAIALYGEAETRQPAEGDDPVDVDDSGDPADPAALVGIASEASVPGAAVTQPSQTPAPTTRATAKATTKAPTTAKATTRATTEPAAVGSALSSVQKQAIVDLARSFIGVRYVHGGMSPSGFDCSGLTAYIYKRLFNVYLPHSALNQSRMGRAVAKSDIQIGDIICFDWSSPRGACDHVGIYIGGGQYIHAAHSKGRVLQSTINFSTNRILTIRRFIY